MTGLTAKQQSVLEFIGQYIAENDRSPALWEIGEAEGIAGTSQANRLVIELEQLGKLKTTPGKQRTIVLVEVSA